MTRSSKPELGSHGLSAREAEVYEHLVRGLGTPEIALLLAVSEHTVRQHRKAVYLKMAVHSQVELMRTFAANSDGTRAAYEAGIAEGSKRERQSVVNAAAVALQNLESTAYFVGKFHSPKIAEDLKRDVLTVKVAIGLEPVPAGAGEPEVGDAKAN